MTELDRDLADPRPYAEVIERMAEHPERYEQDKLSIGRLHERRGELAKRLARAVASGSYELGPMQEKRALIGGKERRLCSAGLVDTIVLFVLAEGLVRAIEPRLSPRLFSYRRGRSSGALLRELGAYALEHRNARPNPLLRGLYVLRADIAAYGESIRVDADSSLWPELRRMLESRGGQSFFRLLEQAIRPLIHGLDGTASKRERGVPTGSPIQPALCNLYLTPVDDALAGIGGGFYGRFGDDLLFAHPDPERAQAALHTMEGEIAALGLRVGSDKRATLYFTAAGRPSPIWPEARATQHVAYLGSRIDFAGRIGLHPRKFRELLLAVRDRLARADELLAEPERAPRLSALCGVVNAALDPVSPTADVRAAELGALSDAAQLRELDYLLALSIAERLSGRAGPRAFRQTPYHELRKAGLWSAQHSARRHPGRAR